MQNLVPLGRKLQLQLQLQYNYNHNYNYKGICMDLNENHHTYTLWVYLHFCVAVFRNIEKQWFGSVISVKNSDVIIYMKLRQVLRQVSHEL